MKKILLILIIVSAITAKADTIPVISKVSNVTVFLKGAQLYRKASVNVIKGKNTLLFEGLTTGIYDKSIQVKSNGNGKILSVKFNDLATKKNKNQKKLDYDKTLKIHLIKIKELKNKIKVYQEEEKFIILNSQDTKKEKNYTFQEIKDIADYYRIRLNEIKQNILTISLEIDSINEQIFELQKKYEETIAEQTKVYSEIEVIYESNIIEKTNFEISYFIAEAGWEPFYDFRVEKVSMPLDIVYNANIFQTTGEKWENVMIKLSTQNPSLSGKKPILSTWKLGEKFQFIKNESEIDKIFENINNKYTIGNIQLSGKLTDAKTKEAISFANIILEYNGNYIGETTTNIDGDYYLKSDLVVEGKSYTIKTSYVGYKSITINNIIFIKGKTLIKNISLEPTFDITKDVTITEYKVPLFNQSNTSEGTTMTYEEVSKMATRGANSLAINTGGVFNNDNKSKRKVEIISFNSNILNEVENSVEYVVEIPYTINSDGEKNSIKIQQASIPANYIYYVTPKIENTVFLTSELIDWNQLKLLTGKASIYYQGTFTGETNFDINTSDDTLKLSLGRDANIFVKREINKQISDKSIIGNNIKQNIAVDITVKNNKDSKIKLVVEDLYPISEVKSMESELIEAKDAKIDDKKGFLTWTIELNPGEKRVLQFKYMIKYPKYSSIQTE